MTEARCYWTKDGDGSAVLIPGCWARVHDPDAPCTCGEWSEETARETIKALRARLYHFGHIIQTTRQALKAAGVPDPTMAEILGPKEYTARRRRKALHQRINEAGL